MSGHDEVVIGLDAGTTSSKLVTVERSGAIVTRAESDPIPTSAPEPGASVQDASAIWQALATACRRGTEGLPAATTVRAVAAAAQSGSVIAVGDHAEPVAITWMDTRSRPLVDSWDEPTPETVRAVSGWAPSPGLGLSTISWLRTQTDTPPTTRWASVDDYLIHELTGSWLTNPSNAAGMQLMNVSLLEWSSELCDIAGIDQSTLAGIVSSGEKCGVLTSAAAGATGLAESTPVVIGGHDQACAALGLGVTAPGSASLSMGTAWVVTLVIDQAKTGTIPRGFNLSPHVVPGRWSVSQNLGGLGAALASSLADTDIDATELERRLGSQATGDDDGFFIPSIRDPERTGWGEFTPSTVQDPMARARAVMEACAFETRRAIEEVAPVVRLRELTAIGGGTRSGYLTQLIADVAGVPLTVRPQESWPALGAAMLAASACGWAARTDPNLPITTLHPRASADATIEWRYVEYRRLTTGERR